MPSTTTVCDRGFTCHTEFDGFDLVIDAAGEDGPTSNEVLLADYASCFVPALRVGGRQRGIEDPGRVDIEAHGDLNADDDLAAIRFHIRDQRPIADEPITGDNRTGEGHLPRPRRPSRRPSRNRNLRNRHGLRWSDPARSTDDVTGQATYPIDRYFPPHDRRERRLD